MKCVVGGGEGPEDGDDGAAAVVVGSMEAATFRRPRTSDVYPAEGDVITRQTRPAPRASSRSPNQGGARWEEATRGGNRKSSDGDDVSSFNSDSSRQHPRRARRSSKPSTMTLSHLEPGFQLLHEFQ